MRDYKIDSLRGIAILSVVLHHILQFSNPLAKDSALFERFFIQNGQFGVELFFIISGYVMIHYFSTINNFFKFMFLRYTRLFPMLGFAIVMILTLSLLAGNFSRQLVFNGLFSLSIIDPNLIGRLVGLGGSTWIDDSFWTLFIEIKFYLLYATIFYLARRKSLKFRLSLLILVLVSAKILNVASTYFDLQIALKITTHFFITQYSGYFIAGMLISTGLNQKNTTRKIFITLSSLLVTTLWSISSYYDSLQTRRTPIIFPIFLAICFLIVYLVPQRLIKYFAKALGAPSYVAYVLHLGIFTFLFTKFPELYSNSFKLGTILVLFLVLSFAVHYVIELRFIKGLRHFLTTTIRNFKRNGV